MNRPHLRFASDYMEGAHPRLLTRLAETNTLQTAGYGTDPFSDSARKKIRAACACPEAEVFFLVGGTQTNATVIDALLSSYQGVVAATSGHISLHEAGAIERGGHKVLPLRQEFGKIAAKDLEQFADEYAADLNREHMVMPGMVYLSQPTEYGTLYSAEELAAISRICRERGMTLYLDGARLAYALASPENELNLADLARLCDVFYIGGTKCGALLGEAVVFPRPGIVPHFFSIMKQHGAVLAKGRVLGLQFDTLFTDNLYQELGKGAVRQAATIAAKLRERGFQLLCPAPTNQIFVVVDNTVMEALSRQVEFSFWEKYGESRSVLRLATSWATREEDVAALLAFLDKLEG